MGKLKKYKTATQSGCLMPLTIAVLAFLLLVSSLYLFPQFKASLGLGDLPTSFDEMMADRVMGYKTAEIQESVLLETHEKAELVVLEQEVEVDVKISQKLWNIPLFEKTKMIHAYGKGVFGIDLGDMTKDSVLVDHNVREVYILLDACDLLYIEPDYTKTTYEDTQRALLAFGDIKMTQEQQTVVNQEIKDAMEQKLRSPELLQEADSLAKDVVKELLTPVLDAVVSGYTLIVEQVQ